MPMTKQILSRLLNLYPVGLLKEEWNVTGRKKKDEAITQIINTASENEILGFCGENQTVTKQHVFIFENKPKTLQGFPQPLLNGHVPVSVTRSGQRIEEFYVIEVEYTAVLGPPYRDVKLKFLWPVSVLVETKYTRVTFTILEKSINAYLAGTEEALIVTRDKNEEQIMKLLTGNLSGSLVLIRADLNKGVKKLWEDDKIDAMASKWKPSRSTNTETMDRNYLMKRDDFPAYEAAIQAPLLKTLFVSLTGNDLPPLFAVTPVDGELMFNRYPSAGEVDNVVRAILAAN